MTSEPENRKRRMTPSGRTGNTGWDAAARIGAALSVLWLVMIATAFLMVPSGGGTDAAADPVRPVLTLVAVLLPLVLIWMAVLSARNMRALRGENRRLKAAFNELRGAGSEPTDTPPPDTATDELQKRIDELAHGQKKVEAALARLNSLNLQATQRPPQSRQAPAPREAEVEPVVDADQTAFALEPPEPQDAPVSVDDFVRAMNFPVDATDTDGFRALQAARRDHMIAGLLRSSEDVLTLLAEDGIYMDDLDPDRSRPDVWRSFAHGERGGAVSSLGGVRDRDSLARAAGLMRQDPVFRDCAHHFLRRFDTALGRFEPVASDADLVAFADTRSARAFMLLGRVSGIFD